MSGSIRVGLIGDYSPQIKAHIALPQALALASDDLGWDIDVSWLATPSLEHPGAALLSGYDALWCVPASPYVSMEGALAAIRWAREQGVPFLGTCGGFQHALLEYARSVLGLAEAEHAESNPQAELPLIAPLTCALVEASGLIKLKAGSRVAAIYGADEVVEQYHCSFGLAPHYLPLLEQSGMLITGLDNDGSARVFELADHPFFMGTLFQPERSAFAHTVHPLIRELLRSAAARV
jgi:CTP synthase (UTP-ammonia lyase)